MEGCAREVFELKEHFPDSRVFGLSRYYTLKLSVRRRYIGLHARLYPLFRAVAPWWDATSDVNHIYGSLSEWHFLRALRRRPIVMTVATDTEPLDLAAYRHVRRFVTHSAASTERLVRSGFPRDRIRLIYPGVDLKRFEPGPRGAAPPVSGWPRDPSRFRIVFATTPNWADGLRVRGVDLMLAAARRLPDVDFYLLWRPWAGAERLVADVRSRAPVNVHASLRLVPDIASAYRGADAVIAPFTTHGGTKICPTSLVEGLACGRPLLVSTEVGISDLVQEEGCGTIFPATVDGLCAAVERLRRDYDWHAVRARPCAERHFDRDDCRRRHEELYDEVSAC